MFNSNAAPSLSDIAAVTGNNDGFGNGNGWWILIILFAIFGGWGGNGYRNGNDSTVADVQRSFDFSGLSTKMNQIGDGIASLGYDQLRQMNSIDQNITNAAYGIQNTIQQDMIANMQQANAMQALIQNCGCQNREAIANVNYNLSTDTCAIKTAVNQASQDIIQNDNANYRRLHDEIVQSQMDAKNDRIAELTAQVQALNLAASQQAQNAYIVSQVRPSPVPAYTVANPYSSYGYGCCNA